ncbi:glycine betaine ABC transporter substrate-binding protein [Georgenia ruanii]|uniref:Glycine/betaine ABC transporter substrate-binding protein n=1 Tax=Georgenia ruanii TaxID=348442 RepID=A0A7J9UTP2_9MICO|nr:glycine betaine ABC transporter substrate-binding protein [Georgenia ruanii]MPV87683.1 glycine/betaine ABC transporter substrate-binding protein [Georgenia ruanii]
MQHARKILLATTATAVVALTACGPSTAGTDRSAEHGDPITIGVHSGWDEGIAVSHLWQYALEQEGYEVKLQTADVGVVFTGLSEGDLDLNFDTWLPNSHGEYVKKFGESFEDLGAWYDKGTISIAVNEDAPITSLDELGANADAFGGRIVGIEPGAGQIGITQDEVMPAYDIPADMLTLSSTPAMLAELDGATAVGQNIAVTMWSPHWAYEAYPIRDLEDPKGLFGTTEEIKTMSRQGFIEGYPEVAAWIGDFEMSAEQLQSLENLMFNVNGGKDNEASVKQWAEENPDFLEGMTA